MLIRRILLFGNISDPISLKCESFISIQCLGKHNSFLAIRIGYESQSPEVVRKIGTELFQDWIQIMDNRMTFLNITALRYHLQNNAVVKSIVYA